MARRILSRSTMPAACEFCRMGSAQPHKAACPTVSPLLGSRLIARLSPLRRSNLMRRLVQRYHDAGLRSVEHEERAAALVGRLSALTATAQAHACGYCLGQYEACPACSR